MIDWLIHQAIFNRQSTAVASFVLQLAGIASLIFISTVLGMVLLGLGVSLRLAVSWINHDQQAMIGDLIIACASIIFIAVVPFR